MIWRAKSKLMRGSALRARLAQHAKQGHAPQEEQERVLSHWDPEAASKFRKEMEEDKEQNAEGYMSREGPCMTMTVLGVSSLFVHREEELVEELV
eukprot:763195-Hanusia_phi.AAC.1